MANAENNNSIEIIDKLAIEETKRKYSGNETEHPLGLQTKEEVDLYKDLLDIHMAMFPLHDILVDSKNDKITALLAKIILQLNALRAELRGEFRTYKR